MILTIDIGNTNIVIGCCRGEEILFGERLTTNKNGTALEYAVIFKNVLEMYSVNPREITGAVISSVVPSVTDVVREAVLKITGVESLTVGPGIKTGLSILTDDPAQLGSDLVVDAVAGISEYPLPLVIFDLGTATTVSVIDEKKNYLGGMILPGMRTALDSLVGKTSQLPNIRLNSPKKVIGTNTVDCMQSGMLYGTAASIDGIIEKIENELGRGVTAVATGGLAGTVIPLCAREIIVDDDLLLKGLMILYNKNKKDAE